MQTFLHPNATGQYATGCEKGSTVWFHKGRMGQQRLILPPEQEGWGKRTYECVIQKSSIHVAITWGVLYLPSVHFIL